RERAEETRGDADVRRLETDVVVVEGSRAVALLALAVRQPADGQKVRRLEQTDAVFERQSNSGIQLVSDVEEVGVRQPRAHGPRPYETPKICMRSDRARGPSSSAISTRCH